MNIIDEVAKQIYEDAHAGMSNVWGWNDGGLDHEHPDTRQRFMGYARSALSVLPTNSDDRKFTIGDRVRKTKGSSWQGRILALLDELDSRQAGCEIADAVIAWMVNRDFADPGNEIQAAQVLEMLDSFVRDDELDSRSNDPAHLHKLLDERDRFIVSMGLWSDFVQSLSDNGGNNGN